MLTFGFEKEEESQCWIEGLIAILNAYPTGHVKLREFCSMALENALAPESHGPMTPRDILDEHMHRHVDGYYDNRLNTNGLDPTHTPAKAHREERVRARVLSAGGVEAVARVMRADHASSYVLTVSGCCILTKIASSCRHDRWSPWANATCTTGIADSAGKVAVAAVGGADIAVSVLANWVTKAAPPPFRDTIAAVHAALALLATLSSCSGIFQHDSVLRAGGARACAEVMQLLPHEPNILYMCISVLTKLAGGNATCQQSVREVDAAGLAVAAMKRHRHRADTVEYCCRLFTALTQIPLVTRSVADTIFASDIVDAGGLSQTISAMRHHHNEASLVVFGLRALGNLAACSEAHNRRVIDSGAIPLLASMLLQEAPREVNRRRSSAAVVEGALMALYNIVMRDPTGKAKEAALALGVKSEWLDGYKAEIDNGTLPSVIAP